MTNFEPRERVATTDDGRGDDESRAWTGTRIADKHWVGRIPKHTRQTCPSQSVKEGMTANAAIAVSLGQVGRSVL